MPCLLVFVHAGLRCASGASASLTRVQCEPSSSTWGFPNNGQTASTPARLAPLPRCRSKLAHTAPITPQRRARLPSGPARCPAAASARLCSSFWSLCTRSTRRWGAAAPVALLWLLADGSATAQGHRWLTHPAAVRWASAALTPATTVLTPAVPAVLAVQILGEDDRSVRAVADEFGVYLKPSSYGMDVKPLVKEACRCVLYFAAACITWLHLFRCDCVLAWGFCLLPLQRGMERQAAGQGGMQVCVLLGLLHLECAPAVCWRGD